MGSRQARILVGPARRRAIPGSVGGMPLPRVAALAALLIVAACCSTGLTARPPSDELARQLHAATGHVPPECYVFGQAEAVIRIEEESIEPACLVVRGEASLTVRNPTDLAATFWVIDSAEASGPPHRRIVLEVPAGGEATVDRLADHVAGGSYRFLTTERLLTHRGELRVSG